MGARDADRSQREHAHVGSGAKRLQERAAGRQVQRQWKLLAALRAARRGLSVVELRDAIDEPCALRTIYRDLDHLDASGFPIRVDAGRYSLSDGAASQASLRMTPDEVLALRTALATLAPIGDAWVAGALRSLYAKGASGLTPEGRAFCDLAWSSAIVTRGSVPATGPDADVVSTLEEAIQREERVRIQHASPGRLARPRIVEPRALWLHEGALYLVAQLVPSREPRKFNVARISGAELLDDPFEPDASFDPREYAARSFGVWHGEPATAVVDFAASVAHVVRERRHHASQVVRELPDGGVRATWEVAGTAELVRWLAGFGGEVRVVGPQTLRQSLESLHRRAISVTRAESLAVTFRENAATDSCANKNDADPLTSRESMPMVRPHAKTPSSPTAPNRVPAGHAPEVRDRNRAATTGLKRR